VLIKDRLDRVLRAAHLPDSPTPVLLPSDSNDAWRIGSVVVRICWRGDRSRFAREAAVTRVLPAGVPYPSILDTGFDGELAWQVTRVVEGVPLATVWSDLSRSERRDAVHQIGHALAALHSLRFPSAGASPGPAGDIESLIGADIVPLPLGRAAALLAVAPIEPALRDEVAARFQELADVDLPADADTWVHGDAHLGNALWKDGKLTALLDFEWVRPGPPDLELEPYLRADVNGLDPVEVREILGWLPESYPALFSGPDLARRLWLYQLATGVRELFLDGPDGVAEDWLRRIVKRPPF
jgi:aminoglycoside phosphotransferase (APT) family kinase protein